MGRRSMSTKKIAVVIPAYKVADFIEGVISSIPENIDLIILVQKGVGTGM
jgi:glycosyltransferase involved in cell wall biosynthesis